jgi:hypothetical protein
LSDSSDEEHVITHSGLPRASPAGWNVDTLRAVLQDTVTELRRWTSARLEGNQVLFATRLDEADKRYEQRFQAEQLALKDAFVAQEKAVTAALTAADRAVSKAELAAERRFEAVNEFRGQLADQAVTFLPRNEFDSQHQSTLDKIDELQKSLQNSLSTQMPRLEVESRISNILSKLEDLAARGAERYDSLNTRISTIASNLSSSNALSEGAATEKSDHRLSTGTGIALASVILSAVIVLVALLSIYHK